MHVWFENRIRGQYFTKGNNRGLFSSGCEWTGGILSEYRSSRDAGSRRIYFRKLWNKASYDIEESSSYNRKYIYDDINREPVSASVIFIPFFRKKRKRGLVSSRYSIFKLRNDDKSTIIVIVTTLSLFKKMYASTI